jgi:plastocyanin
MRRGAVTIGSILLASFLVGGFVAGALGTQTVDASRHGASSVTLTVSVSDQYSFALSTNEVQPGDNVTVTLVELGTTAHTFTLSPIAGFQFNSTDSTSHLIGFFSAHQPLVNLSVSGLQTGQKDTASFIAPAVGLYEYVCLESGHFNLGMFGQLGVGVQGSGGAAPATGPGWPVFAIGGGIAGLVIVTIVLAFVMGSRPGSKHEMPPERLGYPEGPPPEHPPTTGHT